MLRGALMCVCAFGMGYALGKASESDSKEVVIFDNKLGKFTLNKK